RGHRLARSPSRGEAHPCASLIDDVKNANGQVKALNKRLGKQGGFVVPVAQAVIALREKVAARQAPGVKTRDALFSDSLGHAGPPVDLLTAYCHFAVVYRRTPMGLTPKGANSRARASKSRRSFSKPWALSSGRSGAPGMDTPDHFFLGPW